MAGDSMVPCWHWMSPCFLTLAAARLNHVGLPENARRYLTAELRRRNPEGATLASLRLFTINRNGVHVRRNTQAARQSAAYHAVQADLEGVVQACSTGPGTSWPRCSRGT